MTIRVSHNIPNNEEPAPWTKEQWLVDVRNHYADGYLFGSQDMQELIVAELKKHVDIMPEWETAIELIKELKLDKR